MRVELMNTLGSGWRRRPTMVANAVLVIATPAGVTLEDDVNDVGGGGALFFVAVAAEGIAAREMMTTKKARRSAMVDGRRQASGMFG